MKKLVTTSRSSAAAPAEAWAEAGDARQGTASVASAASVAVNIKRIVFPLPHPARSFGARERRA
ncbi:hypothetical protein J2W22_002120 [Sphingomonas kyeonggiensis]|nr:hypothetical protein [Sphingomonas kyeonggiensis]